MRVMAGQIHREILSQPGMFALRLLTFVILESGFGAAIPARTAEFVSKFGGHSVALSVQKVVPE
jgi:hypothetical protein